MMSVTRGLIEKKAVSAICFLRAIFAEEKFSVRDDVKNLFHRWNLLSTESFRPQLEYTLVCT